MLEWPPQEGQDVPRLSPSAAGGGGEVSLEQRPAALAL